MNANTRIDRTPNTERTEREPRERRVNWQVESRRQTRRIQAEIRNAMLVDYRMPERVA